ncbi:histidine phosphatase family protein [Halalkalibacter alkalisediminis]|uniref:Histidine phosphatase family protein n=1 Tax=Halalkalibacter alkalisediminis TaxID=935616 RepID=A0ABV6NGC5_9BACI|nr:histidine phosphatase family protein [Halalkalibacter alkalisediminis]
MGNSLVLTLIRHGLTSFNEEKRYLGWHDLPLSERGRIEVLSRIPSISKHKTELLFTSDLLRSQQTAQLLFPNNSLIPFYKLREFDFGDWEGKTYEQLKGLEHYQRWLDDPEKVTPPNGESFQQFQTRTNEAFFEMLDIIEEKKVKHVTIVCHGGVVRQWLSMFSPIKRAFFEWDVPINARFQLSGNLLDVRRGSTFISLQEEPIMAKIDGHLSF